MQTILLYQLLMKLSGFPRNNKVYYDFSRCSPGKLLVRQQGQSSVIVLDQEPVKEKSALSVLIACKRSMGQRYGNTLSSSKIIDPDTPIWAGVNKAIKDIKRQGDKVIIVTS